MKIPLGFYDQLRDTIKTSEIVGKRVSLTRKGGEHNGLCPFHDEKTPSFTVNDAKRFYHCFGCGAHGDLIRFVAETQGFSYKDASIKIAQDQGIELPKLTKEEERKYEHVDRIKQTLEYANEFFVSQMNNDTLLYLNQRGITNDAIKEFSIGYAPSGGALEQSLYSKGFSALEILKCGLFGQRDNNKIYSVFHNRIMFPIKDAFNKIIAFGGRAVGDVMPKYINSPETIIFKKSEIMFGANIANRFFYKDNYAILVEGYMDVIALHQAGFNHAVASLGTAVTQSHINKLWESCDEIIVCLDGDEAGKRAANKIIQITLPTITANKFISFISLPKGCDPDDLIKKEGKKSFKKYLNSRINLSEKIWQNEYNGKNFDKPETRAVLENKFKSYCSEITDKNLQNNFKRYFNEMIWSNIISYKKSKKNENNFISEEVKSFKQYSEMEFIEYAICSFFVFFPKIISENQIDITLTNVKLEEFKNLVADFVVNNSEISEESLVVELKNTGFYDIFELLSDRKNLFLRDIFVNKKNIDQIVFLQWLCKKHYLLILKSEYSVLLREKNSDIVGIRLLSYLKEIQEVSQELAKISEEFIN